MNEHLLRAALDAAGRGWPVVPLRPGSKVPALHGERRCPRTGDCTSGHRTFEQRATTDPARIERCWASGPYNVGIATGPAGLLVVDLDMPKDATTTVVDLHGHRNDPGFLADIVYVGRPLNKGGWNLPGHPLANPFPVNRNTTRADAVERYRAWLTGQPALLARELPALRGRRLGCWCPADQPCHARVLAELLNKDTPDGAANFTALCERTGNAVPTTRRIRTPSGGQHLYFTVPPGVRLTNTTGTLTPKVDTRAWGGQAVAPGSTTPQGPYTVLDDQPTAHLPEWLHKALTAPQRPATAPTLPTPARDSDRYAAALTREVAAVARTPEGGRQAELLRAVRAVGRFVAWGDLDRADVEAAFTCAGESAGLPPAECRNTIRKALDYSIRTAWPRKTA